MGKLIRNGIEYGGGNGTDIFEVDQATYDALKQAGTLVHNALYVISDAPNLNPTASDIEYSGAVTVKQAIDSKANTNSLSTVATSGSYNDLLNKPLHFRGTLGVDVMQAMKDLADNSICCYADSNNPTSQPTGGSWGSYFIYKTNGKARAYYSDGNMFAISNSVSSTTTTLTWKIFS